MNRSLKNVCAVVISVSLMTGFFTSCGKKINYNPTQGDAEITNNNIADEIISDENITGDNANTAVNGGSISGGSGSYSGGSYSGGGSGYKGGSSNSGGSSSGSNNTAATTTNPTSTTTKYVFDIKNVLNNAPLNPLYTNDEDLDGRIDKIFADIITPNMSTYDKVRAIFNYLVQTNRYTVIMAPRSTMNTYLSLYDREIVVKAKTILKTQTGNCIDFACAFAAMTRRIGLNCYMIKADITNAQGVTDYHGWNIIRINGIDYAFDAQADFRNSKGGATKFTNFGIYNPDKYKVAYTNLAEKSFMNFKYVATPTTTNETDN